MSDNTFTNFEGLEGTATTETTLTLTRRSRYLIMTNDHSSNDLTYKFNASETVGTIKPQETLDLFFNAKQIIINGTSVPYRIWVYA